jgi:hypothetical protein
MVNDPFLSPFNHPLFEVKDHGIQSESDGENDAYAPCE